MKNKNKYNNKKVVYNGIKFDSKKEMNRYIYLSSDDSIKSLKTQVKYVLIPSIPKVQREISYIADFVYEKDGKTIVEDVKSPSTAKDKVFLIKKKLFRWKYGFDISVFI